MAYTPDKIRNITILGHGGDGKTSLAESLLYLTKGTDRLGKIADGNTVCDYDPEEIRRKFSIGAHLAPVEYNGYKINFIDTPGFFDFAGEIAQALRVTESALIVASAKSGVSVGTEKGWKNCVDRKLPRMFYISKMDEEHADFDKAVDQLRESFGKSVAPVMFPVMNGTKIDCLVDVARGVAYTYGGGKRTTIEVPAVAADKLEEYRMALAEAVAETDDDLMEKFFAEEPFTTEEYVQGIKAGVASCALAPVMCGAATTGEGTLALIQSIIEFAPSPLEGVVQNGTNAAEEDVEVKADANGAACAFVFKTVTDQYGRFSFFRVFSGSVKADMTLTNARTGETEKMGHLYMVRGKKNTEVTEVVMGDIGAVSKLVDTKTNDTLCASSNVVALEPIHFAEPCYRQAAYPKAKGGEEKIASGLTKLKDEDLTFTSGQDPETHEFVIAGAGDMHLDVLCSKLKSKFGVDVDLQAPRVAYREKIRKKVSVEGKHKKQSGGHGQYGHVKIEFEPNSTEEFVFEERVFGGSVPKNFFPAVEKGLRDCIERGVLAGYPVVGLKATLFDGSYHDVDSNELSFKMAARLAFKAGMPIANPVIMEPIGSLKVYVPDANMGDIISDLNKRRGRVMGMNPTEDGLQEIEAEVPIAEMATYSIELRSITQGRGSFVLKFERYEDAPPNVQQKVIEDAKATMVDDEE